MLQMRPCVTGSANFVLRLKAAVVYNIHSESPK